jgi:hypothetical protein
MKMSKRIFKSAITLFVMSAMLFSVSLWPSVQCATSARPKSNAPAALVTKVYIRTGRASEGCAGFGICTITIVITTKFPSYKTVRGELSAAADGKLLVTLLEKPPEEGPILYVDQDIPLSQDIAQKLGFKSATIQRGEYAFSGSRSLVGARLTR